jgi:DNA-binding NarL/FixJ family response regulator
MKDAAPSFLLVDDHEFILLGLSKYISGIFTASSVETAKSAEEAIVKLDETQRTYIISDVSLPGKSGIELLTIAKEKYPETKIIILTQHTEVWIINKLVASGADAIVLKTNSQQEILEAIRAVSENRNYYTDIVYKIIISGIAKNIQNKTAHAPEITDREKEILKLIADGLTSKQISEHLFLSEKTIEVHRKNLFVKFDATNSASLIRKAMEFNLL